MSALARRQLDLDLVHPVDHFARLHADAHGTVLLWEQSGAGKRWTKLRPGDPAIPALVAQHVGQQDRFLTVNQFHSWREVRQLRSLRACYVDVDGNTDLEAVLDSLASAQMPEPSFIVKSGRGLHLYWELEPIPAQALPVWQRVQNALVAAVRCVGADIRAKDCTRVLRLVGSVNSKSSTEVRGLVCSGVRWTLHRLADEVLGARQSRAAAEVRDIATARARKGRRPSASGSIYERWHHVYRDIIRIGEHHRRLESGIPEGHRDAWLFLYGVSLSWFAEPETLVDEVARAARVWTPGLSMVEIRKTLQTTLERATKAAAGDKVEWRGALVDPRYRFKRQSLYEWLEPLIPDGLVDELRGVVPDEVAKARKGERDAARYGDRYTGEGVRESNAARLAEARRMRVEGRSTRAVAMALGVSQSTVARWLADSR